MTRKKQGWFSKALKWGAVGCVLIGLAMVGIGTRFQ